MLVAPGTHVAGVPINQPHCSFPGVSRLTRLVTPFSAAQLCRSALAVRHNQTEGISWLTAEISIPTTAYGAADHLDGDEVDDDVRVLARLEEVAEQAQDFARRAKAPNTLKAYRNDWDDFLSWCGLHRLEPLPAAPQTIALYLTDLSKTHKVSTLYRRLSGISQAHQAAGHQPSPTRDPQVRLVFQGIRRTLGAAPDQKNAAITAEVRATLEKLGLGTLSGVCGRALLLVGFAGAFRRSELVSLDVGDVTFSAEGLVVQLRRSKTDQEGVGRKVGLPFGSNPLTCSVRALREWLESGGIVHGPLFRPIDRHGNLRPRRLTDQSVALIVKRCAKDSELDPDKYAGHSLRSGLATAAAMADVSERSIMAQTGHKSLPVVRRYIRDGSLFRGEWTKAWRSGALL
ncbi:MAG: site-specific integrase [Chloroflexi bacterium]|nr:site-specific integrase [Chloroflexota bacterium]MBV9597485.1 site-specific integrase [Chloroflexota bacterium]